MNDSRKTCVVTSVQNGNSSKLLTLKPLYQRSGTYQVEIPLEDRKIDDSTVCVIGSKYNKGDIVQYDECSFTIIEDVYREDERTFYEFMTVTGAYVVTNQERDIYSGKTPGANSKIRQLKQVNLFGDTGPKTIFVEVYEGALFDTERFDQVLVGQVGSLPPSILRNFTIEERISKELRQAVSCVKIEKHR